MGVKCATITPDAERVAEYRLKRAWPSPNGTIRSILDGTVFRKPDHGKEHLSGSSELEETDNHRPPRLRRFLQGRGNEHRLHRAGWSSFIPRLGGEEHRLLVHEFEGPGVVMAIHNLEKSIRSFARSCINYALSEQVDLWFSMKDTISKKYHAFFRDVFARR